MCNVRALDPVDADCEEEDVSSKKSDGERFSRNLVLRDLRYEIEQGQPIMFPERPSLPKYSG